MAITWIDDSSVEPLAKKRVFCRVDFNVPLTEEGEISDDTRIRAALPTIKYLLGQNARLLVASHLGRPQGENNPSLSLEVVAARLQALLDKEVIMADDCIGDGINRHVDTMAPGSLVVLENLRFNDGEESNDQNFVRKLARNVDVFVNEAFSASHRKHASVCGLADLAPTRLGGFSLREELMALEKIRYSEGRLVVVLGGAKVVDKLGVVTQLMKRAQTIVIGGAMAYTFLKAKGENVGRSPVEESRLASARQILQNARSRGVDIVLPVDHIAVTSFAKNAMSRVVGAGGFLENEMGLDIGPQTRQLFAAKIGVSGTLFWNGPVGVSEWPAFAEGTRSIIESVKVFGGYSVAGGGDSVAAIRKSGQDGAFSYLSMGGGAGLEFLEGEPMPGLVSLGYNRRMSVPV